MGKTISTHNGSVAHRDHNIRNPKATSMQPHIDPSNADRNLTLHDEDPRAAYRRIFGAALDDYNRKQTREDRKIRDYYTKISSDQKKHAVYEMIVQIGDRYDTGLDADTETQCLIEFYKSWAERNPHLECIGAYIHGDETDGTVHMHLDYVPVATGYTRGMAVQTGLVKALDQQGFCKAGKRTAQIQWEARENLALEKICLAHGIEVVHPKREQVKHLDTQLYKAQQEALSASQKLSEVQTQLDSQTALLEASVPPQAVKAMAEPRRTITGRKVVLPQQEYQTLHQLAAASSYNAELARQATQTAEQLRDQLRSTERAAQQHSPDWIERRVQNIRVRDLQQQVDQLTSDLKTALDAVYQMAVELLHRLWQQLVKPLQADHPEIWTFRAAADQAQASDPALYRQIQAEQAHIQTLEQQAGGQRAALSGVLRREFGPDLPSGAQQALQDLAPAPVQKARSRSL